MKIWTDKDYPIIISCAKGLSCWTAQEVYKLGYKPVETAETRVVVRGAMRDVLRLNLQLRTAHRVLVPLLRAKCYNIRRLYELASSIDWENILDADSYFTVHSFVFNDSVRDTRLPSLVTKDAIADRMTAYCGRRPDSGAEFDGASVYVHWERDTVLIYIDTTGDVLRRGYCKIPGSAPLQETLAAGCIMAMRWDVSTPFISPMCGSGTPAIEAALMALNRAPGSFKSHFAFMSLKGYGTMIQGESAPSSAPRQHFGATPEQIWKDMLAEAKNGEKPVSSLPRIIATDISPEAVDNARSNALAAGVADAIEFQACDFADTSIPETKSGAIFFNPEYGIRLGNMDELVPLYGRIGDFMKNSCPNYTGGVLTGSAELSHRVGLRPSARIPFYNGRIECRLLVYPLYPPLKENREIPDRRDPPV